MLPVVYCFALYLCVLIPVHFANKLLYVSMSYILLIIIATILIIYFIPISIHSHLRIKRLDSNVKFCEDGATQLILFFRLFSISNLL